ncbi:MAG: ATP-binding cassette domain-containing protein [Gammaproteobacteria bacterium]|nr:ATP-binding cassette domain-containing protein [Gammaproteobacteria bacterium]
MTVAVEIERVIKRFDEVEALVGISARIESGRLTGLVGPDGAGKTTLMRMLAALMHPSEGSIRVAGCDITREAAAVHKLTGYMPQRFGLYEDLSVMENLQLYAGLRGVDKSSRAETLEKMLRFTGLGPFTKRLAGALSGGMKQKLGLACALMARPQVLLLDEPGVGVDPVSRQDLWAMVQELTSEGMAVIWSTSYLDEAERCEDVLLLDAGQLKFAGQPADLTRRLQGRSFLVGNIDGDRRSFLTEALDLDLVRDGVIQGACVRLVLAKGADRTPLETLVRRHHASLDSVAPRFEDAFIDLLGGGPGGRSPLAERMDAIVSDRSTMVECHDLSKKFGDFTATDKVNFAVQKGEILGLLGPNGAGKSTTFKMLCGLLKPSAGRAEVLGLDLRHSPSAAKLQLGYMAQKFSLYGLLSVRQNLVFFSGIYGLSGKQRRERVKEMIKVFELKPYLDVSPDTLPLGFKQRLALACSLMHRPPVLFLDEPTSGVDPITRREFWTHITGLVGKGMTVMVSTHFMEEAEYCDRVALINRGQLIALDTPDRLKASVASADLPEPTMEQAFIRLIEDQNQQAELEGQAA